MWRYANQIKELNQMCSQMVLNNSLRITFFLTNQKGTRQHWLQVPTLNTPQLLLAFLAMKTYHCCSIFLVIFTSSNDGNFQLSIIAFNGDNTSCELDDAIMATTGNLLSPKASKETSTLSIPAILEVNTPWIPCGHHDPPTSRTLIVTSTDLTMWWNINSTVLRLRVKYPSYFQH